MIALLLVLTVGQDTVLARPADAAVAPADTLPLDLAPSIANRSLLSVAAVATPPLIDLAGPSLVNEGFVLVDSTQAQRPRAFHYSDGYYTRLKIHKIASYATIPLFAAQVWSGTKLWNDGEHAGFARDIHGPVAASIAGLFAVNTVTGAWNLWEGRKDPNGRTRRWIHGLLMITADAGFVATGASAPDDDDGGEEGGATRHRNLALGSMGIALGSYLMMLVWKD